MSSSSTESTESNPSEYNHPSEGQLAYAHQQHEEDAKRNTLEEQHAMLEQASAATMLNMNAGTATLPALSQLEPLPPHQPQAQHQSAPTTQPRPNGPGSAYASAMAGTILQAAQQQQQSSFSPPSVLHQLPPHYYSMAPQQLYHANAYGQQPSGPGGAVFANLHPGNFPAGAYGNSGGIFFNPSAPFPHHPGMYPPSGGNGMAFAGAFANGSFSTPGSYASTPTGNGGHHLQHHLSGSGSGNGTFGYACDRCREKHQSCDHEKPCKRCVKANVADFCHYTPKRSRSGKASHAQSNSSSNMNNSSMMNEGGPFHGLEIGQQQQQQQQPQTLMPSVAKRLSTSSGNSNNSDGSRGPSKKKLMQSLTSNGLLLDFHAPNAAGNNNANNGGAPFNPALWPWPPYRMGGPNSNNPNSSNILPAGSSAGAASFPFSPRATKFPLSHEHGQQQQQQSMMMNDDAQQQQALLKRPYSAPASAVDSTNMSAAMPYFPGHNQQQHPGHMDFNNFASMQQQHAMNAAAQQQQQQQQHQQQMYEQMVTFQGLQANSSANNNRSNNNTHPPLPSLLDSLHYKTSAAVPSSHSHLNGVSAAEAGGANNNTGALGRNGFLDHALPESEHANTPADTPHRHLSPNTGGGLKEEHSMSGQQQQAMRGDITKKLDASALLAAGILVQESMRDAVSLLNTPTNTQDASQQNQS